MAAALGHSLTAGHRSQDCQETVLVERRNTDALADAPKDYGDVARTASAGIPAPPAATEAVTTPPLSGAAAGSAGASSNEDTADQQHRCQQRSSARASKLFASTSEGARPAFSVSEPGATARPEE